MLIGFVIASSFVIARYHCFSKIAFSDRRSFSTAFASSLNCCSETPAKGPAGRGRHEGRPVFVRGDHPDLGLPLSGQ